MDLDVDLHSYNNGNITIQTLAGTHNIETYNGDITANEVLLMVENHDGNAEKLQRAELDLISLRSMLAAQVPPYEDVALALDARIREILQLQSELTRLQTEQAAFEKTRGNFLVRMAELNTRMSDFGASINLLYRPEQKREIAGMLQSAFKQIGFMSDDEMPNDDPFEANELMIRYQESKGFGQTGYLTPQVVAFIIQDYLSPVSQNGNN